MTSNAATCPTLAPTHGVVPLVSPRKPIPYADDLSDPSLEPFLILARVRYSGLYAPDDDEPEIPDEEIARIIAKHCYNRPMKASI